MRHLVLCILALTLWCEGKHPSWAQSFTVGTQNSDIYFYYKDANNNPLFTYRVGSGGDIAEFVSSTESNRELLPPGDYAGQVTDRVMQLVSYDDHNIIKCSPDTNPPTVMWNVNQAGDYNNKFQATVNVVPATNNQQLDVYSVGDLQWGDCTSPGPVFRSRVSMLTRYLLHSNGILQIHRLAFMRRPETGTQGNFKRIAWQHPVHQNWLPFLANTADMGDFDSVALTIVDGKLMPALQWPDQSSQPFVRKAASDTHGYAILYNSKTTPASTFVAVVYGKSPAPSNCNCAWQVLAKSFPQPVLMAGPELLFTPPANGSLHARLLVQSDVFIYPGTTFDHNAETVIRRRASDVPAPVAYDPQRLPHDIAPIFATLKRNLMCQLTAAMRTDHMVSRITGSCSP